MVEVCLKGLNIIIIQYQNNEQGLQETNAEQS